MDTPTREHPVARSMAVFATPPTRIPDPFVVDAPLLGNGDVGIALGGDGAQQVFYIGKSDFWRQPHLGETDAQRRDRLLHPAHGYAYYSDARPLTVGRIILSIPALLNASYRQEQDLLRAEVRGTFERNENRIETRCWMQAEQNLFVCAIRNSGLHAVPMAVSQFIGTMNREEPEGECGVQEGCIWFTRCANAINHPERRIAAVVTRVMGRFAIESASDWDPGQNRIVAELAPGSVCHVIVGIFSDLDARAQGVRPELFALKSSELVPFAVHETIRPDEAALARLTEEHRHWWSRFWSQSSVEFNDPELERFYYGAHYILACCMRKGKTPPGLWGNWLTTDWPKWTGSYTLNYNYEAPWWGLFAGNHVELVAEYARPLLDALPMGRLFASEKLGCNGIYLPVELGPWGIVCGNVFHSQKSNALFGALNILVHFAYTRDSSFAKQAYPYLREVADFWEDYLAYEDGVYNVYKDHITEAPSTEDKNNVATLGFLRCFLRGMLDLSAELGLDADRRDVWKHILAHLPPYPTQVREGKTVYRASESGTAWMGRGGRILWPVYPANQVGLGSDPGLLAVARSTLEQLDQWDDPNAFCTFYPAAVRLGYDPDKILERLREQCRRHGMANLWVFHFGGGLEECSGVTATIQEMLLQSHDGILRLFPCWPSGRDARFEDLRAVGAFLVSSEIRQGRILYVRIRSEAGGPCVLFNPWTGHPCGIRRGSQQSEKGFGAHLVIDTSPGDSVTILPDD